MPVCSLKQGHVSKEAAYGYEAHTGEQGPMQTQGNDPGALRRDEGETGCAPGAGK